MLSVSPSIEKSPFIPFCLRGNELKHFPSRQAPQGSLLFIPHTSRLRQQDGLPITNVGSDGNPTEGPVQHVGHDTFVCHPRRLVAGIHLKRNQERSLITHDGSDEKAR